MSIFFIWSMASMTRLAFCGSGSLSISPRRVGMICHDRPNFSILSRSEEHTSELQSRLHLVCRLLLEKKKHSCVDSSFSRRAIPAAMGFSLFLPAGTSTRRKQVRVERTPDSLWYALDDCVYTQLCRLV